MFLVVMKIWGAKIATTNPTARPQPTLTNQLFGQVGSLDFFQLLV